FAALAFTGHRTPAGATNSNLVTVPTGTRTNNRLAITVLACALRPARGQPREVALEVRAVSWASNAAPQACCHDLRMPEGVAPQTDLPRVAITVRISARFAKTRRHKDCEKGPRAICGPKKAEVAHLGVVVSLC